MEIYKLQQFSVLLLCTSAGFVCGVIFDVFKSLRNQLQLSNAMNSVADILFWIICTVIVYFTIYYSNNADIRWFEFLGLATGFFSYILIVHKFAFKLINKIIVILLKIFSVICIPFKFLHILVLPVKNLSLYMKSRGFFIFHKTFSYFYSKTKNIFTKKPKNET